MDYPKGWITSIIYGIPIYFIHEKLYSKTWHENISEEKVSKITECRQAEVPEHAPEQNVHCEAHPKFDFWSYNSICQATSGMSTFHFA